MSFSGQGHSLTLVKGHSDFKVKCLTVYSGEQFRASWPSCYLFCQILFSLDDELLETEAAELSAATRIQHVADDILIRESGKLVFLIKLLDQLKEEGHRCLVFSQSRKILDIMQKVLTNKV